jgi:hypothetical protein
MNSYESEALFLASLPVAQRHETMGSMIAHLEQFKGREYPLYLAQALLLNTNELYKAQGFHYVVKKCVEMLRALPDPDGNIGYYATHVEQCCV